MRRNARLAHTLVAVCVILILVASVRAAHARGTITLTLDASDAPKKVLHSKLVIPVDPGPLTLSYPKWIPGEHGPTGPLTDVAGLKITAGGKTIPWQRDLEEMYAIHVTVPDGVKSIDVDFDFLAAAAPEGFNSAASCTENLVIVTWNQVLFYPGGESSDGLTYAASLKLPAGWKYDTALPVESGGGSEIRFAPVSLTKLVDSPVLAGEYFRRVDLTPGTTPHMYLCMASDSKAALAMPDSEVAAYRHLAAEALSLFGAWHFKEYRLLVPMSDHISHFGLEHHESSEDRVAERMWLDDDIRISNTNLMPHELTHSWNGKYRRPAGLATPDYGKPMTGELLWVYEGLTQYLGFVLSSRSGIRTLEQGRENLALRAAELDNEPGRTWRPLVDTAVEAQRLYGAANEFAAWRRGVDFYDEGLLIWLDADVTIRKLTNGRRSLDDFCKRFHGGENGVPKVVPYTRDDVIRTLNDVAPHDWRGFLAARIDAVTPRAPLGGVEQGGWKLVYTDSLPPYLKSLDEAGKTVDLRFSLGMTVNKEDGLIVDVIPGSAAAKAGVGPGMKMVAVNGRHWSKDLLVDAVTATKNGDPLELLVDNNEFYRTCKLDYRGGARYPWLKRDASKPDLVSEILKAHAPSKKSK